MPCTLGRSFLLNKDSRDAAANRLEDGNVIPSFWSSEETDVDKSKGDFGVATEHPETAPDVQLVWLKDEAPVSLDRSRSQDPTSMALTVRYVTKNDTGTYACAYVEISSGEVKTTGDDVHVIVEGKQTIILSDHLRQPIKSSLSISQSKTATQLSSQ